MPRRHMLTLIQFYRIQKPSQKWIGQNRLFVCKTSLEINAYHVGLVRTQKSCFEVEA